MDRGLILAELWIEADTCPGCGGSLSVELTDVPPAEDHADHGHAIHKAWCRSCVARERWSDMEAPLDENAKGTTAYEYPQVRRVWTEPIPLPQASDI